MGTENQNFTVSPRTTVLSFHSDSFHSVADMGTTPPNHGVFARLVPTNIAAMSLFSRAVECMTMENDEYHLLFVDDKESSLEPPNLDSSLDSRLQGEMEDEIGISDYVTQQVKNKGSFLLSFEAPLLQPTRGWSLGLGKDGSLYRDVDFMLGWHHGPSSQHVAPVHLHLRFNRRSGILLLIAAGDKPVELFIEQDGWISLQRVEQRALYQPINLIRLGEYRFDLVYALPQGKNQINDYLAGKHEFFHEKLETQIPKKFPWLIPSETYSILGHVLSYNTLTYGGFGWISNGIDIITGDPVAIKEISIKKGHGASISGIQAIQREIEIGVSLKDCKHVAPTLRAWCEHNRYAYCGGENEKVYLTSPLGLRDFDSLDFAQLQHSKDRLRLARGTLLGLAEIHSQGIIHRDIQTKNLLVMSLEPPTGVIIDFGKATKAKWAENTYIGPKHTLAPEVWGTTGYTNKIDIWSWAYAITMKLGYRVPRDNPPIQPERAKAMRHYLTDLAGRSGSLLVGLINLLLRMLQVEPGDRPTAEEALRAKCWDPVMEDDEPRDEETTPRVKRRRIDAEASREIQETRKMAPTPLQPVVANQDQDQFAGLITTQKLSSSVYRRLLQPKSNDV
ncbi:hypothetical protein GJ744_008410 [Endocarpon pusillum]|uniref:Protein kinase domain-containing protein n=1 Tax=Endocarpon pusillum TaxID=364733 RepID=A0A8H7APW5_9EURO|nr:hypothetical protein GJ744_008410 [Endocarpon pusillum]